MIPVKMPHLQSNGQKPLKRIIDTTENKNALLYKTVFGGKLIPICLSAFDIFKVLA